MDIPYEQQFHFHDGSSIGSLEELRSKVETLSYQDFYMHVNAGKNDFANWIQYVIKNELLADDLRKVTSIVETVEIINDFLNPRPLSKPDTDMQSRIEQSLFPGPVAVEKNEDMTIEQVPVTEPAKTTTHAGFTVVEEQMEEMSNTKVKEELFHSTPAHEEPQPVAQQPKKVDLDPDMARMIVKDFMYGLVFGLIIGIILGKILSF